MFTMFICSISNSSLLSQSIKCLTVKSCYSFTFIKTLSDVHQDIYGGDAEEEYRDDAVNNTDEEEECQDVNNTDDNLVRAHRLEHC